VEALGKRAAITSLASSSFSCFLAVVVVVLLELPVGGAEEAMERMRRRATDWLSVRRREGD
jgi:hypothetical protein